MNTLDALPKICSQTWACSPAGLAEWMTTFKYSAPAAQDPNRNFFGDDIPQMQIRDGVAIVPVRGILINGAGNLEKGFGASDHRDISDNLSDAEADPNVIAIVLDISSPGGSVAGTEELASQVASLSKRTVAFCDSLMASAALWIGASCDQVLLTPGAVTGCIGTILSMVNFADQLAAAGIEANVITSGALKASGSPLLKMQPSERQMFQELADAQGATFRAAVQRKRPTVANDTMQGAIYDARRAVSKGLADKVVGGGMSEAVDAAKKIVPSNDNPWGSGEKIIKKRSASTAETEWRADANLRREFGTLAIYKSYVGAEARQAFSVSQKRGSTIIRPASRTTAQSAPHSHKKADKTANAPVPTGGNYEAQFKASPALQEEFGDVKTYSAFMRGKARGALRVSGRK